MCSLRFVDGRHNVVVMGTVGVGKTFLAAALARRCPAPLQSALRAHRRLLKRLKASRLDKRHDVEMRKLMRVDLLVLDDFSLQPLDALGTANVYELIVELHRCAATITTSNR